MIVTFILYLLVFILIGIALTILRIQIKARNELQSLKEQIEKVSSHSSEFTEYIQTRLIDEKKAHLLVLMYDIRDAVSKQKNDIHANLIINTPRHHNLSNAELAKMFSAEQIGTIQQFWASYTRYLHSHWIDHDGKVKTIFRGNKDATNSELFRLHHSSNLLVKQFDQLLTELNYSS
ncbi:hypothetical protein [Halalkalibacter okhensis]|uniref:Uncharacterized protein n=1 Tax=Halalkalibacter okhensis TaxID=333138 RepID=A0A0B0IDF1_9BACI|nr:hypothetical protein [Halalkalibacter okhensis]KHF38867.1 hypothetical protein LQ50_18745 [Halalkalibacter okhensis]